MAEETETAEETEIVDGQFNVEDPAAVLQVLHQKAAQDAKLASQIEAAFWQVAAMKEREKVEELLVVKKRRKK